MVRASVSKAPWGNFLGQGCLQRFDKKTRVAELKLSQQYLPIANNFAQGELKATPL